MAQEARLCGACRKHTLQTLYKGTRLYRLSTGCSLCELIRPEVVSHLGLSEGDELPEVKLRVVEDERGPFDFLSMSTNFNEISRLLKQRLWFRFPHVYDIVKFNEHPFGRLGVLTPVYGGEPQQFPWMEDLKEITQLKVTPLEGRSLTPCNHFFYCYMFLAPLPSYSVRTTEPPINSAT